MPRQLFRLIIPAHAHKNVFSAVSSRMTSLGPVLVATCVNKSFSDVDVEVIDENNYIGPLDERNLPDHKAFQEQRPAQFVGFYCSLTSTMPRVYELAKYYQAQKALTVGGGAHVNYLVDEALQNGLDIVVRGEGEEVIVQIIKAAKKNLGWEKIAGISFKKEGKIFHNPPEKLELCDLNSLPYPDFGLLRWAKKMVFYPLNRTRGCSRRCEFCTVNNKPRWVEPEKMFNNIAWLVQSRKAKHFFIVDDRLNEDAPGTEKLFRLLAQAKESGALPKNLSFTVQIRLEAAREEELLKLMYRAGVRMVCIGYESPIAEELQAMRKGIKPEDMVRYTKIFKKHGFWVHAMMIFGYPARQEEKILMSVKERITEFKKFIKKAKPDTIQVLLATPIPGTELYERLEKQGRIYPRDIVGWENYDGGHLCFEPDPPMSAQEVQRGSIAIMRRFYSGWNFWKIPLVIFAFPFVVPFGSFSRWYRLWRNSIWGYAGHRIVKKWLESSKQSRWLERLSLAQKRTVIGQM